LISKPSDWTPLKHRVDAFNGCNKPGLDLSDPWQFKNFLVANGG
jgi:homospermidine synthase